MSKVKLNRSSVSRFSRRPGSVTLQKYSYKPDERTFHPDDIPVHVRESKREVQLGMLDTLESGKPKWNSTTVLSTKTIPSRGRVRQLSEYQSLPFEYNFRAEELPQTHKKTVFVDKGNKFRVDQTHFLSGIEKEKLQRVNPTFTSRMEIEVSSKLEGKTPWNVSTELWSENERKSRLVEEDKMTTLMCKKKRDGILEKKKYVSPLERERIRMEEMRKQKVEEKKLAEMRAAKEF